MQQQGINFLTNLMNMKKPVMIKYLYNKNTQKEMEIYPHNELYKEFKKQLNKTYIAIFINDQACPRKDKLENHISEKQPLSSLEIKVYTFQWLAADMIEKKKLIEQLKTENNKLSQTKSLQEKQILDLKQEKENLDQKNSQQENEIIDLKNKVIQMQKQLDSHQEKRIAELVTSSIEYTDNHTLLMKQKEVQYYNDLLKSKYERKISLLSSYPQNCISSIITTQLAQCHFCQQLIHDNFIILSCSHSYHQECLENLIEAQLTDKQPNLKCLCNNKISQQTLNQLDQLFAGKSLLELNVIQLEEIKKNKQYNFVKCRNRLCHFFYIQTGQFNNYCPLCLQ